jgi:hypothetical protein
MEVKHETPDDLISQVKKAGFDVACIMLIFVLFANLTRHFNPSLPHIKYEQLFIYSAFLIISAATLRRFKRSLAQLFTNAIFIGFAATMASEIHKGR